MVILVLAWACPCSKVGGALRRRVATRDRLPDQFDRHTVNLADPASWGSLDAVAPDYLVVTPTPQSYDPAGYQAGFAGVAKTLASQKWIAWCHG